MAQYRIGGKYSYHEQAIPYTGFLHVDGEKLNGHILDEAADCRLLVCEGVLKYQNGSIVLEFQRRALQSTFPQNTLSDAMAFTFSKRDDGKLIGTYEGTWKFAERCYNIEIGIDKDGEKSPIFYEDTNTTGRGDLTLEEILQE